MRKKNNIVAIWAICLLFITIILLLIHQEYNAKPTIENIKYENKYNEDRTRKVTLSIKRHNSNNIYCQFIDNKKSSNWILVKNDKCSYNVVTNKYKINVKYNGNQIVSYNKKFKIDGIVSIKINNKKKFMAIGETFNLDVKLDYVGDVDTRIFYKSSNPEIVSVDENGNVTAHSVGNSKITAYSSNKMEETVELNEQI